MYLSTYFIHMELIQSSKKYFSMSAIYGGYLRGPRSASRGLAATSLCRFATSLHFPATIAIPCTKIPHYSAQKPHSRVAATVQHNNSLSSGLTVMLY